MKASLQIIPLERTRRNVRRFLQVPYALYAGDPHWVAPLLMDLEKVFQEANPLFEHAEMQLWVARRDGRDVGRIAGILEQLHNRMHGERTVFFGFFECIHDQEVADRLLGAVEDWARGRGMNQLLGPMNPTTNDECGLLVEGFDSPPVFMMTYNPRYYAGLVESAGFARAKDLLAYDFDLANTPMSRFERIWSKFQKREPEIRIEPVLKKTLERQLTQIQHVYNEAWEENWGFVPMTDAEIQFMAARLKPLLVEGLTQIALEGNEPVGFLLASSDFNEGFQPLKGRLLSPGLFKALPYLLQWKVPKYCRVLTLGVKASHRGRGIEAAMLTHGLRTGFRLGFKRVESSWILEDNTAVQRVIQLFGGEVYKRYRLYGKGVGA
ncbi:MAG: GNAT family N-acetyltransferase [Verrucomicrobia bacterium]|jgi:GNAT superfamily N-acetyltransferase|nr:GNAT family N-acetyltransferase [Verrucomicrobiota bacterium]